MKTTFNGTTIRVVRLPAWAARVVRWWWGALQHDAFTIGHTVFVVKRGPVGDGLLAHEATHARQVERIRAPWPLDVAIFIWRYARENRRVGYQLNRYEVEARDEQRMFAEQWTDRNQG